MELARTVAALIGAVGTVAAVVVALWLQWLRVRRRRPSLTIDFDSTHDRVNVAQRAKEPQEPLDYRSHWVRPRVINERGRDSAEDVQVLLVDVKAIDSNPGRLLHPERNLEGLSLKWSEVESEKATIPPGVTRHFDLVHVDNIRVESDGNVVKPEDGDVAQGDTPVRFDVCPVPTAKYYRGFCRKYKVTLGLSARNTNPTYYSTVVAYDLEWREDMAEMQEKLMVEEPFDGPESDPNAV